MIIVMYDVSGWYIMIIVIHQRTYKAYVDLHVDLDVDSEYHSEEDITRRNDKCMQRLYVKG